MTLLCCLFPVPLCRSICACLFARLLSNPIGNLQVQSRADSAWHIMEAAG